jgi:ArsR family metal-binding transcriptional regulator
VIETYQIRVTSPACEPGSERISVFASVEEDISDVLPYLNAVWPEAIYDHANQVLTGRHGGHAIAIRPHEVAISDALDRDDAERLVAELVAEINDIWARRGETVPRLETRRRPVAMDIFKLLPRTNCKVCGQRSCFTFALQLAAGDADLAACAPLDTSAYDAQRQTLRHLLDL